MRRLFGCSVVTAVIAAGAFIGASPASATITAVSAPQLANTATAGAETISSSNASTVFALGAATRLTGPGSLTETYDGTGNVVTPVGAICTPQLPPLPPICIGGTSSIAASFNLDPTGLPAAPGVYALIDCVTTCAVPSLIGDSTTVTVTGDAPTPAANVPLMSITQGTSGAVDIPGTGFAKDEQLSVEGIAANKLTFTENNGTSSATDLKGTLAVDLTVPAGVYDMIVTDTAGQTGTCVQCLHVAGVGTPPGAPAPVTNLDAHATGSTTGTASWTASDGATDPYTAYTSATGAGQDDPGVTTTVDGTSATITGLTADTQYTITVTPHNASGAGDPATKTFTTGKPTHLAIQADATSITIGDSVNFSGLLTEGNDGLANQTVYLAAKPTTGKAFIVKSAVTTNSGGFSTSLKPKINAKFFAYYPGNPDQGSDAALSGLTPKVKVAPIVKAKAKSATSSRTKPLVVKGKVKPNEAGRKVILATVNGAGIRHRIATTTLDSKAHFRFASARPSKKGTYTLVVLIHHSPTNAKGVSPQFTVTRT
jgi:hypothetical protein